MFFDMLCLEKQRLRVTHMKIRTLTFIISIFIFLLLLGCSANETSIEKVEANDTAEHSSEKEERNASKTDEENIKQLTIGESVKFEETTITFNEARIEPGGEFEKPTNDNFLIANLTAVNNSKDQEFVMSSLLNVELEDAKGNTYSATILTEAGDQFDGSVEPGETMTGDIPFDVSNSDQYELHFSNPFQSGEATWIIDADELVN